MTGLSALGLPIVLSAVFVFVASSVLHMLLPWHKTDYKTLPNEDKAMDALRALAIPPGDYMVPRPSSREDMGSAAFAAKLKKGPVMVLTVMPSGPMAMGRTMALWFVYCLAMGVLAAYVTGRALPPGTPYLRVFRFAGATAFIGYSAALWQMAIWYRRSLTTTIKSTIDGLIYGLLTAGAFGWLWPR
jgi:ABC-type amino acid transport system permease subunit